VAPPLRPGVGHRERPNAGVPLSAALFALLVVTTTTSAFTTIRYIAYLKLVKHVSVSHGVPGLSGLRWVSPPDANPRSLADAAQEDEVPRADGEG
jgi:hypothetical protein